MSYATVACCWLPFHYPFSSVAVLVQGFGFERACSLSGVVIHVSDHPMECYKSEGRGAQEAPFNFASQPSPK
eukprot:1137337-Amphidinium_carterae.1